MNEDQLTVQIIKYLKENKKSAFEKVLDELQPYDIAQLYRNLPEKNHLKFLLFLTPKEIADLIQELESDLQIEIIHRLGVEKSSKIMDLMENDNLADLLSELSVENIQEYLSVMKAEDSTYIQNLMSYSADTAGGLMTNQFMSIKDDYTVQDAVDKLKSFAEMNHTIYYLYVINDEKQLVGVVSYRDLVLADTNERISKIMFNRVISVPVDLDQEEVANLIERYDFIALPVVDENHKLLGIVTVDDVIDVVIQEANEDIEKLSASGKDIDFYTKATTAAFRRLPWLILLLFIGLISGSIISGFEETLEQVVALVFFMPMIAGMTGNTGTQSLAVVVRGLITHKLDKKTVLNLIIREFRVGIIIGIICGLLIAIIALVWMGSVIALVVGISLILTLIIGTLAGTLIPLLLYKLGVDPAVASGPLITTLNDIFSLIVYFSFATAFLAYL
ncbi:magnesium transporter [Anaerobacillus alkalilacustris]|uniref:Magnesium transporter MgtE n=1 Tax=Anaerobacillus alkalilacustris TaxID=393763 RepID=A0A1S2LSC3_9BACI|nr:magnesium transporter [Anaerobacillus alkalilacustris]OIJ15110.1 magnesium transporter [Anaerobacillus alkalilacustris]